MTIEPSEEIFATYSLILIGPKGDKWLNPSIYTPTLRETEENLTDLMPTGYRVEIHEWFEDIDTTPIDSDYPRRIR